MLIHPFSFWSCSLDGHRGKIGGGGGGVGVGEADETATQSKVGCNYSALNNVIIL